MLASRVLHTAAGAAKTKPRYVRRQLNKADVAFALTVGFVAFPALGLLYFNDAAKAWAAPHIADAHRRYREASADIWLMFERFSGREGEVSEAIRRQQAKEHGMEYRPKVVPPPPVAPSREEVRELLRGPESRRQSIDTSVDAFHTAAATDKQQSGAKGESEKPRIAPTAGGSIDLNALVAAAEKKKQQQQQ